MDTPLFSIVLPMYNAEKTLARAIESVLDQTSNNWELILVDDGSADDTFMVAQKYADEHQNIHAFQQVHGGCGKARQKAASHAQGAYVVKLDADDGLEPAALEILETFITTEPGFDIYSATAEKVYPDGSVEPFFIDPRFRSVCSLELSDLLDECYIFGGCSAIRREVLERIGGFRDVYCEDYDVWLRALALGATHRYTPQSIYRYYFGTSGHMNEDPTKSLESFVVIFNDLVDSGVLSAKDEKHARASIGKFQSLLSQYRERGVTEATFTDKQARAFQGYVEAHFSDRVAAVTMQTAGKLKWIVKPLRVFYAKLMYRRSRGMDRK